MKKLIPFFLLFLVSCTSCSGTSCDEYTVYSVRGTAQVVVNWFDGTSGNIGEFHLPWRHSFCDLKPGAYLAVTIVPDGPGNYAWVSVEQGGTTLVTSRLSDIDGEQSVVVTYTGKGWTVR